MIALLMALSVALTPAPAVQEQPDSADQYAGTWAWCADAFPDRPDLQGACRWGAYMQIPETDIPTPEWRA